MQDSTHISLSSPSTSTLASTTSDLRPGNESDHPYSNRTQPPHISPPKDSEYILGQYLIEREKFIKHLEKRHKKFIKRSKEDYDAARWGKVKPKKQKKLKENKTPAQPLQTSLETPVDTTSPNMLGSNSARGATRIVANAVNGPKPSAARTFASTSALGAKRDPKKTKILTMDLPEATRVLRALEIEKHNAAFRMKITIVQPKAKGARNQVIRGRVVLPFDSRKSNDVMLVFAEAKSESARLAQEQGVDYIGAQELFEPLLNGEINPTKILATPSMLPSVTARLARFLGPKGLMPTTRRGGVGEGEELVALIREARGALDWTSSEDGVIEAPIGRASYPTVNLEANCRALIDAVKAQLNPVGKGAINENLISRRTKRVKQVGGIDEITMWTTNAPRIGIKET